MSEDGVIEYVLGFVFDESLEHVLLIEKKRPAWMNGKLNGIGGKVEFNEYAVEAMHRECLEETGYSIPIDDWVYTGKMGGLNWSVDVFTAIWNGEVEVITSQTDEPVYWFDFRGYGMPVNSIGNLNWLIPYCRGVWNRLTDSEKFEVSYA